MAATSLTRLEAEHSYSEPQSGLDTFNRRIAGGKSLSCTLNPEPFYPLPYQCYKLQRHRQVGFNSAQPTFLERSRKEDLSSSLRELGLEGWLPPCS